MNVTHDIRKDCQRTLCGLKTTLTINVSNQPTCKKCQNSKIPESERAR